MKKKIVDRCKQIEEILCESVVLCKQAEKSNKQQREELSKKLHSMIQKRKLQREDPGNESQSEIRDISKDIPKDIRKHMKATCKQRLSRF